MGEGVVEVEEVEEAAADEVVVVLGSEMDF